MLHLVQIDELARRYGLPLQPTKTPAVGQGKVYSKEAYRRSFAAASIALILGAMIGFARLDWGFRLFGGAPRRGGSAPPEPKA